MLFTVKEKSERKILNKMEPDIDIRGTPKTISIHVLVLDTLFVLDLCFLVNKWS